MVIIVKIGMLAQIQILVNADGFQVILIPLW